MTFDVDILQIITSSRCMQPCMVWSSFNYCYVRCDCVWHIALVGRRSCMFVILKDAIRSMARHHIFEHIFGNITVTVELALLSFSFSDSCLSPLMYWNCWLGISKWIQPIKIERWGAGMVICLEWDANDLHMVQLLSLPLNLAALKPWVVYLFCCHLAKAVLKKGHYMSVVVFFGGGD